MSCKKKCINNCTEIGARVWKSLLQNIPSGVNTVINFGAENYDTDNIHDNSTNNDRLTCKTKGKYIIQAQALIGDDNIGSAPGHRQIAIFHVRPGSPDVVTTIAFNSDYNVSPTEDNAMGCDTAWDMEVGDYVYVTGYQDTGFNLPVFHGIGSTWFTMNKVSCSNGKDGADGEDGAPGTNGVDGTDGADGTNGTNGINGTDGTDGADGVDGTNAAIMVEDEPPGLNCPNGGTKVTAGTDTNGDGIPDTNLTVEYVCNPDSGGGAVLAKVVKTTPQDYLYTPPNATELTITWESEVKDTNSFFDISNPTFLTIDPINGVEGDYFVHAKLQFSVLTIGVDVKMRLYHAGGNIDISYVISTTGFQTLYVCGIVPNCLLGHFFAVGVGFGGSGTIDAANSYFAIHLIK